LQSYKFGRTVTIPASSREELPESVYTALKANLTSGLHTLILLEVDVENNRHITIPQALTQLLDAARRRSDGAITPETLAVTLARLGAPDMALKAGTVTELMAMEFGEPPHSIIIPGHLHFIEGEALEEFAGARKELVLGKA
jgi:diphthine synthase